jgi:hypothetical protein
VIFSQQLSLGQAKHARKGCVGAFNGAVWAENQDAIAAESSMASVRCFSWETSLYKRALRTAMAAWFAKLDNNERSLVEKTPW